MSIVTIIPALSTGNYAGWRFVDTETASWLMMLKMSRNGSSESEVANKKFDCHSGQLYEAHIEILDILGKVQIHADGKSVFSCDKTGTHKFKFRPGSNKSKLTIHCVERTGAHVTISSLIIKPI